LARFAGLIFDIGDTLFDATCWRRWLAARLRTLGVDITYAQLVRKWEAQLVDVYRGRAEYWTRFAELLALLGLDASRAHELIGEARACGKEVRTCRALFPGVRETLCELRGAGVRIAALSDTESTAANVRQALAGLGVGRYFHAVVSSADIGYVKPEPQAYRAAADALGLAVADCAFVGHDEEELRGASDAGMFAVAYNHQPDARADVCLDDFRRLIDLARPPAKGARGKRSAVK